MKVEKTMKRIARLIAAAALPVISLAAFAGTADAAGTLVLGHTLVVPADVLGGIPLTGTGWTPGGQAFVSQCVSAARQASAAFDPTVDCELFLAVALEPNTPAGVLDPINVFNPFIGLGQPTTAGGKGIICDDTHACRVRVSEGTADSTAVQSFLDLTFAAAVVAGPQTITFPAVPAKLTTDAAFTLAATASSGLPVTYSVVSGPATVSGNTVTLTGAIGTVVLAADQAGDASFTAAPQATVSFAVTGPNPVVPEAPLAILLPLGAMAALGGAYFLVRKGRTQAIQA
jgi:hypothetical protein